MATRTRTSVHFDGPINAEASIIKGPDIDNPCICVTFTADTIATNYFLENNAQDLSTTAAALRVLANRIDELSDQLMVERLRSSLLAPVGNEQ